MFYGEFIHSLDNKGRLILPAKIRDMAKENNIEKFFLTRGLDRCIFMFSEFEWQNQEQKFRNMPFTKQESRTFNRLFFSGAAEIIPDKQGRFIIPQYLKDFAEIERDAMIIGVSNRIEIWDKTLWQKFYSQSQEGFESLAEKIFTG